MPTRLLALFLSLLLIPLRAQETPVTRKDFSEYPQQYRLLVAEAMKSFQARDFKGSLTLLDKADAIEPPTVWTLNVRGAIAIEQKDFAKGVQYCTDALKLDPTFFPAKFNLIEIPFLQERYAEARKGWTTLLDTMSADHALRGDDSTAELLTYRIYLTYLFERDFTNARIWLEKITFPSRTPAYQYSQAAWERMHDNHAKWKEWIQRAELIWPESKRTPFTDVLIQRGWLRENGSIHPE